jgi:hypothetical protein
VVSAGIGSVAHLEFEPDFAALAVSLSSGRIVSVPLDRALAPAPQAEPVPVRPPARSIAPLTRCRSATSTQHA